jgi:hypothetical protein
MLRVLCARNIITKLLDLVFEKILRSQLIRFYDYNFFAITTLTIISHLLFQVDLADSEVFPFHLLSLHQSPLTNR